MPNERRSPSDQPPCYPRGRRPLPQLLLAAGLPPLVAFVAQSILWSTISPFAWFLFYPAVFVSAWLGRVQGGLGATLLSAALAWWRFIPPERSAIKQDPKYLCSLGLFIAVGLGVTMLQESLRLATTLAASRRANERLRRAIDERRVCTALLDASSDFIGISDEHGHPVYINPAGRRLLGLGADHLPPDLHAFVSDVIVQTTLAQGHWKGETYFRHWQTGAAIPVSDEHFLIWEPEAERVLGIGTIARDISDVGRARDAIGEREERLAFALKGADLAAWDWNVTTGEVIFNPRWAEMRGYHPDEVKPHVDTWIAGVHPEDWPHIQHALADHFEGRTTEYETEHRVATKSGEWIWILDRGKVFARDAQGRPTRMVGTELDITHKKRIEHDQRFLAEVGAVLASTLEYEETLTNVARLAVRDLADYCIVDIIEDDGEIRRLKVASRDPGAASMCDRMMVTPPDRSRAPLIRSVLESRQTVFFDRMSPETIDALSLDEEHQQLLRAVDPRCLISAPLLAHGQPLGVITLVSATPSRIYGPADVSLAEELTRRAALAVENARLYRAAQQATQARDEVLGVVAHDLRNPLGTILMQAQLLRRRGAESDRGSPPTAERIERAAQRMNRLIEDLLDVARLDAGRLAEDQKSMSAEQLVSDSVHAQQALAAAAYLELRPEVAPDLPEIWGDRDRLLQVFENLIGNALKFTNAGGRITVGATARDAEVLFWVADTGAGIGAEDLPRLFDRFWQAKKCGRRGAGLGLAIVKGIVEAHGGRIWVESTPGRGSTFFFTIPLAPRADLARPETTLRCA